MAIYVFFFSWQINRLKLKLKRNTASLKNSSFQTGCVSHKRATTQTQIPVTIDNVLDVSVIVG